MTKPFLRVLAVTGLAVALAACSSNKGYQSTDAASGVSGGNGTQGTDGMIPAPVQNVDMKGYIEGGNYEKTQTFDLDKERGELLINLPLGMDPTILVTGGSVPQLPGVTFATEFKDGVAHLVVRVPLKYILRRVTLAPADKLPNGQPLVGMPTGEAATIGFNLNPNSSRQVYMYLGVEAIGIYVESPWLSCYSSPICVTQMSFPIKNAAKTQILGNFNMFMPINGKSGAFFITSKIPPAIAVILDDYFM